MASSEPRADMKIQLLLSRLDAAEQKIKSNDFRGGKGLGNEVGYYVFDYPAEHELLVRDWVSHLQKKLEPAANDYKIIVFDLYDIVIDMLEADGFLDKCYVFEQKDGIGRITRTIGNFLRMNDDNNKIVAFIQARTPKNAIVFLTGIGKCFPFLRSHKVLNNLHQVIDTVPVILFFPGIYDGQELALFGEIKDDNYYRAFRLVD
jgi:hypothetical protein